MKRSLAVLAVLVLAVVAMALLVAPAQAISPNVVISQVYGGGGLAGASHTHDFIELVNRGSTAVSLAGWSVQYASSTGTGNFGATAAQITPLPAVTLLPGQYYLIRGASAGAVGAALPPPDLTDGTPIDLGNTNGKVALANIATTLGFNGGSAPGTPEQLAHVIDLVGYGDANYFEGTSAAPAASRTLAVLRTFQGLQDTDDNHADFGTGYPAPRTTASAVALRDLILMRLNGPAEIFEGNPMSYEVTLRNVNQTSAITVSSIVHDIYGDLTAAAEAANGGNPIALAPGAVFTFTWTGSEPLNPGTVTGTVTVAGHDSAANPVTVQATSVVTVLNRAPSLTVTKSSVSPVRVGTYVSYTFVITNTSPASTDPVQLTHLEDSALGSILWMAEAQNGGPVVLAKGQTFTLGILSQAKVAGPTLTDFMVGGSDDESTPAIHIDHYLLLVYASIPAVATPIPDQTATEGVAFGYTVPADTFTDLDVEDVLTYSATLADGSPLPTWLTFTPATRAFSGTPPDGAGTLSIRVTATDRVDYTGSDTFDLTVTPTWTITPSAGPNGGISPATPVEVLDGEDRTFTITPDAGFHVADVLVDGSSVGAVTSYTFTDVDADHTISATFGFSFSGFLSPLAPWERRVFSTAIYPIPRPIPVKFVVDHAGVPAVTDLVATLTVTGPTGTVYFSAPFTYNARGDYYLCTIPPTAYCKWPWGTYTLTLTVEGGETYQTTMRLGLRG